MRVPLDAPRQGGPGIPARGRPPGLRACQTRRVAEPADERTRQPAPVRWPGAAPARAVEVLALDRGLADGLAREQRGPAELAAWAPTIRVAAGGWDAPSDPRRFRGWLGLLVLEGLLARHVAIGAMGWTELLGPGDVLRPWTHATEAASSLPARAHYEVVEPAWLVLLDRDFAVRVASWPEIPAALVGRAVERSRWLAYQLAAGQPARVEERVWTTLWHLADRFGRVTGRGVELRLPHLTHAALATMLGVRRPTVSTAMRRLVAQGLVTQAGRGRWLLHGDPGAGLEGAAAALAAAAQPGAAASPGARG